MGDANEAASLLQNPSRDHHNGQPPNQLVIDMNNIPPPTTVNTVQDDGEYDKGEQERLLEEVKNGNWKLASTILQDYMTVRFVTEAVDATNGRTILHYACYQERNKNATNAIRLMLSWGGFNNEDRRNYMDKADKEGDVAIQLAAKNTNRQLVSLLIAKGADVSLPNKPGKKEAIKLIYENMPDVIGDLLESNLKLEEDEHDPFKDMFDVKWDFTPVTGVLAHDLDDNPSKKFESQTLLLSTALQENKLKRSEVLLHPLVQLFLHYKHEKCVWWIRGSMAYHIFWSILSIICMVHYAPFPAGKLGNSTSNPGDCECQCFNGTVGESEPEMSEVEETPWLSAIPWTTLAFWMLAVVKEFIEFLSCPNRCFYAKQFENIGQWILLVCVPVTWISTFWPLDDLTNFIATVGILIAGLLVLGQLNKTKLLGIYMEMLVKVVKNIVKFLMFFFPLLATFALLFRLLLPARDEFRFPYIAKVSAMMTGEIGYDEVFHNDDKGPAPHPLLTQSVFLCFVLLVVIVLQNLLIGLTLSDIQELKKIATENHVAKQLEQIYLIENFLLSIPVQAFLRLIGMREVWLKKLMVEPKEPKKPKDQQKLKELDKELQQVILTAVEEKPDRFKE